MTRLCFAFFFFLKLAPCGQCLLGWLPTCGGPWSSSITHSYSSSPCSCFLEARTPLWSVNLVNLCNKKSGAKYWGKNLKDQRTESRSQLLPTPSVPLSAPPYHFLSLLCLQSSKPLCQLVASSTLDSKQALFLGTHSQCHTTPLGSVGLHPRSPWFSLVEIISLTITASFSAHDVTTIEDFLVFFLLQLHGSTSLCTLAALFISDVH